MKILCTICMREKSKGIPNKNLKKINGKSLMYYTINHAIKAKLFNRIIISTDSKKIFNRAISYGAEGFFLRDKKISNDFAPKVPVIRDALIKTEEHYKENYEYIFDLDVTSPLRSPVDIKKAYKQFVAENSNNLISATISKKNPYFNLIEKKPGNLIAPVKKLKKIITRRQDSFTTYDMNASIYIWKRKFLLKSDSLFTNKTSLYLMNERQSFDIDTNLDFEIVEFLLKKQKNKI